METSLEDRMRRKGIDMSWRDRARAKYGGQGRAGLAPLYKEDCHATFSIYLWRKDGSLWTVDTSGKRYSQVRAGDKPREDDTYLCLHCKQMWSSHSEAQAHVS